MKQRLLQIMLFLSVGLLYAIRAFSYDVIVDGIYYNLVCYDGEKTVAEVTNNGEWTESYSGDLVIPSSIVVNGTNYPVNGIGNSAFQKCTYLNTISIPESVSLIDFYYGIGMTLFSDCINLSSITVSENNPNYCSVDGILYNKDKSALCCIPAKKEITTFNVPESVINVVCGAFAHCENLEYVTLPSSFNSLNDALFLGCTNLIYVSIPNKIDNIPNCLFSGCKSLKNVTIPNSVRTIGSYSFSNSGIESIECPNSVTCIEEGAFSGCDNLTSITLGNSISEIGYNAFDGCYNLNTVKISDLTAFCNINANNLDWFGGRPIFDYDFSLYLNNELVNNLVIPNTVKKLRKNFSNCRSLRSVTVPSSVEMIYSNVFSQKDNLSYYGSYIEKIAIGSNVAYIDESAFSGCWLLNTIEIAEDNQKYCVEDGILFNKDKTLLHTFPRKATEAYTIPTTVKTIGECAFESCYQLPSIHIPSTVTNIGSNAFKNCYSLETIICDLLEVPEKCPFDQFSLQPKATLYVPYEMIGKYKASTAWNRFANIWSSTPCTITIGTSGKATYCSYSDLDFTGVGGMKAYVATGFNHDNGSILLTRIYQIPSGTGFMLVGNPGTYEIPVADVNYSYANLFAGTLEATEVPMTADGYTHYILANGSSGVMFYKYAGGTLSANKAYLRVPSSEATTDKVKMKFSDDPTTVDMIDFDKGDSDAMFNLKGQRIYEPQKGIYIKNGKTYVK